MNVLVVEDQFELREPLLRLGGLTGTVYVAKTSQEALEMLDFHGDHFFNEIWLDHDLGLGDDSMVVVDKIVYEFAIDTDEFTMVPVVRVHTANPVGRDNIVRALRRHDIPHRVISLHSRRRCVYWTQEG